jgi:hypothetical protein
MRYWGRILGLVWLLAIIPASASAAAFRWSAPRLIDHQAPFHSAS